MLYVNNEELKEGMPQWDKYQEFLDKVLPNLPNTVIFKRNTPIKRNATGITEVDPRAFTPFEALSDDEKYGSQHWRYCVSAPRKNKDGKWIYKPLGMEFKRSLAIKKSQPDFIFFMMDLCHKVKDGTIICEDRDKEAREVIAKDEKDIAVKFMINNKLSPLSPHNTGSEDLLRMIAAAWGISHAHNKKKSLDIIRVELLGVVTQEEMKHDASGRGFDTFLGEIQSRERIVLRANIQRAVDNQTISYNKNEFTWVYMPNKQVIKTLASRFFSSPENGLFEYFLHDDNKRKIFYATLEDKYEVRDPSIDVLGEEVGAEDTEEVEGEKVPETTEEVKEKPKVEEPKKETVEDTPDTTSIGPEDNQRLGDIKSGKITYFAGQKWAHDVLKIEGVRGMKKPELLEAIRKNLTSKKQLQD